MKPQEGKSADVCKAAALLDIVLVDTISAMAQFSCIAESEITLPARVSGSVRFLTTFAT